MPVADEFDVSLGTGKSTVEPAFTHMKFGAVSRPNALPLSWYMLTNGTPTVVGPDAVRTSGGGIGKGTVPIIPFEPITDDMDKAVHQFLNDTRKLLQFKWGNGMQGEEFSMTDPKLLDSNYATINQTPEEGILMFRDAMDQWITADNIWLQYTITIIQSRLTNMINGLRPTGAVGIRQVGYGILDSSNGLDVMERPGSSILFFENKVSAFITAMNFSRSQLVQQFNLLYVLGCALQEMAEVSNLEMKNYSEYDWMAYANSLLLEFVGSADIAQIRPMVAFDIMERIFATLGVGISASNRFVFNDRATWESYITFCILFGIIMNRTKATLAEVDLRLMKNRMFITIAADLFAKVMEPEFKPGGASTPWYMMPRNYFNKGEIALPMVIPEPQDKFGVDLKLKGDNRFKLLRKPRAEFTKVEARDGKAPMIIELDPLKETHVEVVVHTDVQRYEVKLFSRDILIWKFRYRQARPNLANSSRMGNFVLGMMFGSPNSMTNGFQLSPEKDLFGPTYVDDRINMPGGKIQGQLERLGEHTISKDGDTGAVGRQVIHPGTVPGAAAAETPPDDKSQPEQGINKALDDAAKHGDLGNKAKTEAEKKV